MAFLGSLGKALGLENLKTQDVVTGVAKSVNRELQSSMDKTDENISRLSQLRLDRVMREQSDYDSKLSDNSAIIKDMVGKVGSVEAVSYLIDTYGFSEAQTRAEELNKKVKLSGGTIKPTEYLGIEKATKGKVTASQLADYVTPSKAIPEISEFGDVGVGIASTLFDYGKSTLKKRSDAEIKAAGYGDRIGKTSIKDLPDIKARGMYEWQVYSADSALQQASFLQTVQTRLLKEENSAKTADEKKALEQERLAAKAEQDIMLAQYDYEQGLLDKTKRKPLKPTEVEKYTRGIGAQIATHYGLADDDNWTRNTITGATEFRYAGINAIAEKEMKRGAQSLVAEIEKANLNGIDAAEISDAIFSAVANNTKFTFVPSDDFGEGEFVFEDQGPLIDDTLQDAQGQLVFTGLPQISSGQAGAATATGGGTVTTAPVTGGGTATTVNPAATATVGGNPSQQDMIDALKQTTPGSVSAKAKKAALLRIYPNAPIPAGY